MMHELCRECRSEVIAELITTSQDEQKFLILRDDAGRARRCARRLIIARPKPPTDNGGVMAIEAMHDIRTISFRGIGENNATQWAPTTGDSISLCAAPFINTSHQRSK